MRFPSCIVLVVCLVSSLFRRQTQPHLQAPVSASTAASRCSLSLWALLISTSSTESLDRYCLEYEVLQKMHSSRKRHRQSDDTASRNGPPSKRITLQSPSSTNTPKTNPDRRISKAENEISLEVNVQKRCMHKLVTSCHLSYTPCCCACVDKRPNASSYLGYIDGEGLVLGFDRWYQYCPGCRRMYKPSLSLKTFVDFTAYWESQEADGRNLTTRLACSPSAEIMVEADGFHLHYSTTYVAKDLTLGVIKAEMADFLNCRQSELVLTVNGSPLGPDSLVYGMGAFAPSTKHIMCKVINEDDSFDEMEDVR